MKSDWRTLLLLVNSLSESSYFCLSDVAHLSLRLSGTESCRMFAFSCVVPDNEMGTLDPLGVLGIVKGVLWVLPSLTSGEVPPGEGASS